MIAIVAVAIILYPAARYVGRFAEKHATKWIEHPAAKPRVDAGVKGKW